MTDTATDADAQASAPDPAAAKAGAGERVVIKKYANRRLYNTATSVYVTLDHLRDMVRQGVDFVVYDAKTNEDITRSVLSQIIFEQEGREGQNLLPVAFLRQLIRFYGDNLQAFLPGYLEMSLASFAKQQERMREQFGGPGSSAAPGGGHTFFEEQVRQNMALFNRAMGLFAPFAAGVNGGYAPAAAAEPRAEPAPPAAEPAPSAEMAELKAQLAAMQAQIEKLAAKG